MFPNDLWQTMCEIAPLRRYFVAPDYDQALTLLRRHLNFRLLQFTNENPVNHWRIPPGWILDEAGIYRDGKCLYDASRHPNQVIALSLPFQGTVTREVLREHLHYDHRHDDWIPFHFRQMYRPWDRTWGFCVPKTFYDSLAPGEYEVRIRTKEYDGTLKVAEAVLPGRREETIVFVAHLDHPAAANDDLAGVMAGVRLMQLLAAKPRRFTYRLVVVQEILGSEYYLNQLALSGDRDRLLLGLFLEMLGSRTPHCLQRSFQGDTAMDWAMEAALGEAGEEFRAVPFRESVGNDEANWEAHGVPMPQLSRYPYPEYHSDRDDMSIIDPDRLEASAQIALRAMEKLEELFWVRKLFRGSYCASHPEYNLYIDPGQAAFADIPKEEIIRLRRLMDLIPIVMNQWQAGELLARKLGLSATLVNDYLRQWVNKGLLEIL